MHDGVEVAAVAQVLHASEAGAKQGTQGGPRLLDHLPLPNTLVHRNLQLCHSSLSLRRKVNGNENVRYVRKHRSHKVDMK